jgi:Rrf2 family protein
MLSRKTKYGLKALSFMARREGNEPVQISVISESENISQKFLESILLSLRKAGYLGSKKGKGGGYYLLERTRKTPIAAFYRILEGPIAMVPCVSLNFYERCSDCPDESRCDVHNLMIQVRDNTLSILENTSLEEFVKNPF